MSQLGETVCAKAGIEGAANNKVMAAVASECLDMRIYYFSCIGFLLWHIQAIASTRLEAAHVAPSSQLFT
ncbi:hypothetical protein J2D73_06015 [Acetobacter sacchari]|uniref:Uncharacterized protein n=1 Tax=Acetobacter sacchari TaxID=2661687 RepID=A0ABS3LTW4_9PROT|nr:hypothetical protein [Acetobacter sacchari]MBO1359350.1 hypothetical protein [Acetobacter sacchari]